jgi:hypothetical protein
MKIITNNSTDLSILKPIPPEWETLRRKVARQSSRYVAHVRELAARQGFRLMHRRNDQYWLMRNQPMSLDEIADLLQ